jgi:Rrf2 family protein
MFSQTVEYALRAMMFLASLPGAAVSNDRIATGAGVPAGYLSKVMRDLVRAGLVVSSRGPGGGFVLRKDPAATTLLDVVNAVDPIRRIERCPVGNPLHNPLCALHARLDHALEEVERSFSGITFAELLRAGPDMNGCAAAAHEAREALNRAKPHANRPRPTSPPAFGHGHD